MNLAGESIHLNYRNGTEVDGAVMNGSNLRISLSVCAMEHCTAWHRSLSISHPPSTSLYA
jgi:hypothetical protein